MATYCKVRGVAGLVVDGAIRDQEALCEMDMPIYAKSTTPNGPYKNGPVRSMSQWSSAAGGPPRRHSSGGPGRPDRHSA